jgi:beta-glucosidase
VSLEPGETRTVTLPLAAADLAYWDSGRHAFVVEPGPVELLAGRSSADHDLTLRRTIVVAP